jgi:hypothetical protein
MFSAPRTAWAPVTVRRAQVSWAGRGAYYGGSRASTYTCSPAPAGLRGWGGAWAGGAQRRTRVAGDDLCGYAGTKRDFPLMQAKGGINNINLRVYVRRTSARTTRQPTQFPTSRPTSAPSAQPTTRTPTATPTTARPTAAPTAPLPCTREAGIRYAVRLGRGRSPV